MAHLVGENLEPMRRQAQRVGCRVRRRSYLGRALLKYGGSFDNPYGTTFCEEQ